MRIIDDLRISTRLELGFALLGLMIPGHGGPWFGCRFPP